MTNMQWLVKNLQEVCKKIKAGGTPRRGTEKYWGGEISFVKIEDIVLSQHFLRNTKETITEKGLENSNAWLIPTNSVLFSIYASIGEVAINKRPVVTNQAILGIIPNEKMIDYRFLYYTLKKFGKTLIHRNIQSTQKNLTLEIVKNLKILLPPLPIQQKIVKILDTIQEAIEMQEKIIETTKELKKSVMADLFKYGAPSFRNSKFQAPNSKQNPKSKIQKRKLKKTEIGEIPEDWELTKLGEVCRLRKEQSLPSPRDKYVGLEHIKPGEISIRRYGVGLEVKSLKNRFYPGDLLYGKLRPYLDKAVISDFQGICSTDLLVIVPDKSKILSFYLINILHMPRFLAYATGTMSGTNHPRTNWKALRSFLLPLPPLPEQREIAEILQIIDRKIELEQKKKELHEELFKTMLHKIMSQEIDVEKIKV